MKCLCISTSYVLLIYIYIFTHHIKLYFNLDIRIYITHQPVCLNESEKQENCQSTSPNLGEESTELESMEY